MGSKRQRSVEDRKKTVVERIPSLEEVIRGTFITVYLEYMRSQCKCHTGKKWRHGPYYRVSYGKGKRVHHIYVPLAWKDKAKEWTENYWKVWKGIEQMSALNIRLMKASK